MFVLYFFKKILKIWNFVNFWAVQVVVLMNLDVSGVIQRKHVDGVAIAALKY